MMAMMTRDSIIYHLSIEDVISQISFGRLCYDKKLIISNDKAVSFLGKIKDRLAIQIDCINKDVNGQKLLFIRNDSELVSFCKLYKSLFNNTTDLRKAFNYTITLKQSVK